MTFKQIKTWLGWNVGFIFRPWRILVKFNPTQRNSLPTNHPYVQDHIVLRNAVRQWLEQNAAGEHKILKTWLDNYNDHFLIQFKNGSKAVLFKMKWLGE